MMVSGFGMCCGYYQKFKDQKTGVVDFTKTVPQDLAIFRIALCAGLRNVT